MSRLCGAMYLVLGCCWVYSEEPDEPKFTAQQREQLLGLRRSYAAAKDDLERKAQVVDQAVKLGPAGARRLESNVRKEFEQALAAYSEALRPHLREMEEPTVGKAVEGKDELIQQRNRASKLAALLDKLTATFAEDTRAGEAPPSAEESLAAAESKEVLEAHRAAALATLDSEAAAAIVETNRQRVDEGLPPLVVDPALCRAAADHSFDMIEHRFFSHTSPIKGKEKFTDRAKRFGTTSGGENLTIAGSGRDAVKNWMASPGHRANILKKTYRRIGLGRAGQVYTQMFGR